MAKQAKTGEGWIGKHGKTLQFVGWALTAVIGLVAWYTERVRVTTLSGGTITETQLDTALQKNHVLDSATTLDLLEDFKVDLNKQGQGYINKYWEPMVQSNEELRMGLEAQRDLTHQLITAQGSLNSTVRDKLLREAKQDSLAAENARLKAELKTKQTVSNMVQDLKDDLKPKRRDQRDKIE